VSRTAGAVSELLDRSVGTEEYVIRAAAEGTEDDGLIDLNTIDFEALAVRLASPGVQQSSLLWRYTRRSPTG
jgi:type I restriction enzyme, R subunit